MNARIICGSLLVLTGTAIFAGRLLLPHLAAGGGTAFEQSLERKSRIAQAPGTSAALRPSGVSAIGSPSRANLGDGSTDAQGAAPVLGVIDIMRETERQQMLIEQLKPLLAQRAIYAAERESAAPAVPQQLIDLAGEREARRLVAAQASLRAAANAETQTQDVALTAVVEGVTKELAALHARLQQIDTSSSTRSDRLKLLQTASKGVIAGVTLGEARMAVAEVEERRQDVLVLIAQAEQRLAQARQDRAKLANHARTELEQALLSTEAQISQAAIGLKTSQAVLAALKEALTPGPMTSGHLRPAPSRNADL